MKVELHLALATLCVFVPAVLGQNEFAALLGSLGFGGGGGSSMSGSGSCPYQPHPNKFKFTQVVNNRVMTQDCAPGTMFDIGKCSCVTSSNSGARPMPGSNPRLESPFGGTAGDSPFMGLLQQMTSGSSSRPGPSSRPAPPAPFRPMSRSSRIKPGRVSDMFTGTEGGLSLDLNNQNNRKSASGAITYSPNAGMKPAVDTSLLPDVIPQEVLKMLNIASNPSANSKSPSPLQTTPPTTTAFPKTSGADMRAEVLKMLNKDKGQQGKKSNSSSQLPQSVLNALNMGGQSPVAPRTASSKSTSKGNVLAPDIMNMLEKAMKSPFPITPAPTAPVSKFAYTPVTKTPSMRIPTRQPDWFGPRPTPTPRAPSSRPPTRSRFMSTTRPGPRPSSRPPTRGPFTDPSPSFSPSAFGGSNGGNPFGGNGNGAGNPMDALLSLMQGGGGMGGLEMGMGQRGGMGGQDPLAELLGRMNPSGPSRGSSSGHQSGMDPFAALFGGSSSGGFGGPGSNLDALLRQIGGPSPSSGGSRMGGSGGNPFGGAGGSGLGSAAGMMAAGMTGAAAPVPDMTNFFNAQGRMGVGLAQAANIDMFKLQQLDRQGVIDISDLTPQGLAAANAHFSG